MSFIGSINAETRKWLGNNGAAFDGRQVYVGCSGNFSVEQLLSRYAPKARIWGNDVSIYSGALGAYLANQPFELSVQEEDYKWLEAYLEDVEGQAAAIMVLLEALKYEKANNAFKARHWAHYCNNFAQFHQATVERLRERKQGIRLEGYTGKDIFDLLDEVPKDGVVIAFLPTYAGGYERMFKRLGEIFKWDEPRYEIIDEERKKRTILKMMERDYLYLDDRVYPGLPMVAVVRKARMKPVYIYSNLAALRLAVLKQQRRGQLLPGRLPVQGCRDSGGWRSSIRGGRGREGLRLSDLCQDAGAGGCLPPGRLRGQFHPLPKAGEAPAPGDSDQGDSPHDGGKAPGGTALLHHHGVHRQAGVHEVPGPV